MTTSPRHRLGVDLGTSTTIAMLQWPDGRVRPLLFDGSPLLSSAVLLGQDGSLHTGRDAAHLGRGNPERLEPNPKRRIDDDVVLLGAAEVPVRDLLAAVLGRVAVEAGRVAGRPGDLTITHPAAWGSRRCALLVEAAERSGLGRPRLVAEPVAAATYFAHTMSHTFPPGSRVVVYDLGAGTCDVTVLRRQHHGFDIIASDGLNDVGGLDVDAALVAFLEATYGRLWSDAVSRRQVWDEVRTAKEMLSRTSATVITIPTLGKEAPLGREQFDGLIGPVLRPTIALTKSLIRDSAGPVESTALVLVGGASRIPLVATLLSEATGIAPIVIEQPELVVAEGALHVGRGGPEHPTTAAPADSGGPVHGGHGGSQHGGPGGPQHGGPAPVSGGGGPAWGAGAPAWGAGVPVSGAGGPGWGTGGPAVPVSGVSGPAGPVSGGFIPAPGGPWQSGHAPGGLAPGGLAPGGLAPGGLAPGGLAGQPRAARGGSLVVIASIVAAVILVLGAGTAGIVYLNRSDTSPNKNTGTGTGPVALASTQGPPTTGRSSAGKYPITKLPENLCRVIELGRLATTFEKEAAAPTASRNLNTYLSIATCTTSRQHALASVMSASFTAYVYGDTGQAVTAQKQAFDNAKLNDPATAPISGVGEEAFVARTPVGDTGAGGMTASFSFEMRDGNMRWTVFFAASRINSAGWTEQERAALVADLGAAVKASHAKVVTG